MAIATENPKGSRKKKHYATKASAWQIRSAVKITKGDSDRVAKVMTDLGYLSDKKDKGSLSGGQPLKTGRFEEKDPRKVGPKKK